MPLFYRKGVNVIEMLLYKYIYGFPGRQRAIYISEGSVFEDHLEAAIAVVVLIQTV